MRRPRSRRKNRFHRILGLSIFPVILFYYPSTSTCAWRIPPASLLTRGKAVTNLFTACSTSFGLLLPRSLPLDIKIAPDVSSTNEAVDISSAISVLGGYRIPANQYSTYQRDLLTLIPSLRKENVKIFADRAGDDGEIEAIMRQLSNVTPAHSPRKIILVAHSRGAAVAVRVAARLASSPWTYEVRGLLLIDPVDEQETNDAGGSTARLNDMVASNSGDRNTLQPFISSTLRSSCQAAFSSSFHGPTSSCLPLLRCLPPRLPVVIVSLPFTGLNSYYRSPNRNICAPPGRDARAFFKASSHAAAASVDDHTASTAGSRGAGSDVGRLAIVRTSPTAGSDPFPASSGQSPPSSVISYPLLLTLPFAGHLQLLDDRLALPFAEVCGVSKSIPDKEVQAVISAVIVACCEHWLKEGGGQDKEPTRVEALRQVMDLSARTRGVRQELWNSITWGGGGARGKEVKEEGEKIGGNVPD